MRKNRFGVRLFAAKRIYSWAPALMVAALVLIGVNANIILSVFANLELTHFGLALSIANLKLTHLLSVAQ